MKYGPSKGELKFRLAFSIAGLCLLAVALYLRGLPEGPGLVEVVGLSVVFFGGTAIFAIRGLMRRPDQSTQRDA